MGICCGIEEKNKILSEISSDINNQYIVLYSKVGCPKCVRTKSLLHSIRANPFIIEVNNLSIKNALKEFTKQKSLPYVFIGGTFIETRKLEVEIKNGNLQNMIKNHKVETNA